MQGLIDVRAQLDRYAAPELVEWHFASINSRWTKRSLTTAGFGYVDAERFRARHRQHWNPVYSFAALDTTAPTRAQKSEGDPEAQDEIEIGRAGTGTQKDGVLPGKLGTVHGLNRPFFHIDVQAAVESAIAGVEYKLTHTTSGSSGNEVVQTKRD